MELPAHAREPAPMTASPGKDASLWGCPVAGNAARPVACEMRKLWQKSFVRREGELGKGRRGVRVSDDRQRAEPPGAFPLFVLGSAVEKKIADVFDMSCVLFDTASRRNRERTVSAEWKAPE